VQVVRGKQVVEVEGVELLAAHDRVIADVGTGDGRFAYALAREDPGAFVVGIDAIAQNLRETSHKASRKPSKGGLPNVAFVVADAETPPPDLHGSADEIHVILPWGKLMVGLLEADPAILGGLRAIAKPGARLHLILNGEVWSDPVPVEARDLPDPTVAYVRDVLTPAYAQAAGIAIGDVRDMPPDAAHAIPSTWAKKLGHGRPAPRFVEFEATFGDGPAVTLRDVVDADLPAMYEHQADPAAVQMADIPSRKREDFYSHWGRLRVDPTVTLKAVVVDGQAVGHVVRFLRDGEPQVGYALGREHWGRGIATAAFRLFLAEHVTERPLYARAIRRNGASLRVLEKCGFEEIGGGRDGEAEVVLRLTRPPGLA
jgi:16S rRNA (adenine(1408)-N(1))-methyltransferase